MRKPLIKLPVVMAMIGVLAALSAAAKGQIFLGPAGSVPVNGNVDWSAGANGAGFTEVDFNDPARSGYDFTISNTVAGKDNKADWRCPPFSLGAAAGGARPITFSFSYKLADPVADGNNIQVELRFFNSSGDYIGGGPASIGARTGDSAMTGYRQHTINDILTPPGALTADIWITANVFQPWVSGAARFGDFSVTTVARSVRFKMMAAAAVLPGLCALTLLSTHIWRRNAGQRGVAPGRP
jgi:hypothetical protein